MFLHEILKNPRSLPPSSLLEFKENNNKTDNVAPPSDSKTLWANLMGEYGEESTIHGLSHVFARKSSKTQRFLWILIFCIVIATLIHISLLLAHRHNERKFETVVDTTKHPIYKIPFPEVTICNQNRLNWARFELAKKRFLQPSHQTEEYSALFAQVVSIFDTLSFGEFEPFSKLSPQTLKALNYINFTSVVNFMTWRCPEFLTNCSWREIETDCCEVFIPRKSQLGLCWAFNSVESDLGRLKQYLDPKWPWRATREGPGSGLRVTALINEKLHSPLSHNEKGVSFMIVEPTVWYYYPLSLSTNSKVRIVLDGYMSFFDDNTRSLSSRVRECLFKTERTSSDFRTLQGHLYMFENCQAECQQEYSMKFCNCSMEMFFPPSSYPACKLEQLACLAQHSQHLVHFEVPGEEEFVSQRQRGMKCDCYLNCRSLRYWTDVRSRDLMDHERWPNTSLVDMDFHFVRDYVVVYRTRLVYTWVDLLVSFGGIIVLFLGCSLISIVELVYFFCLEVPQRLRKGNVHHKVFEEGNRVVKQENVVEIRRRVRKLRKF